MSSTSSSSSVSQTGKTSKKFKKKNNQSSVTSSSALPPETSQPQVVQEQSPNDDKDDEREALNDTIPITESSNSLYDTEAFKTIVESNTEFHAQFMKNMAFQQELLKELRMNANHSNSTSANIPFATEKLPNKLRCTLGSELTTNIFLFNQWKETLKNTVLPIDRMHLLLNETPENAWIKYQQYGAKLTDKDLEELFIKSERALWNFMWESIDETARKVITTEMESNLEGNNLTKVLKFKYRVEDNFFHNCYEFLQLIEKRYRPTNIWRIKELKQKEMKLFYDESKHDPSKFIQEYKTLQQEFQSTIPGWTRQAESIQAIDILVRMPKDASEVVNRFSNPNESLTIKEVELALKTWYEVKRKDSQSNKKDYNKKNVGNRFNYKRRSKQDEDSANAAKEQPKKKYKPSQGSKHTSSSNNRQECKFFAAGNCRFEDKCKYLHGKSTATGKHLSLPAVEVPYVNDDDDQDPVSHYEEALSSNDQVIMPGGHSNESSEAEVQEGANLARSTHTDKERRSFILDSGATSHFSFNKDWMESINKISPIRVNGINGMSKITECGTIKFNVKVDVGNKERVNSVTLNDVRYCQDAKYNLISIAQLTAQGFTAIMTDKGCYIVDRGSFRITPQIKDDTVLFGKRSDNTYVITANEDKESESNLLPSEPTFSVKRAKRPVTERKSSGSNKTVNQSQEARLSLIADRSKRQSAQLNKIPKLNSQASSASVEAKNDA